MSGDALRLECCDRQQSPTQSSLSKTLHLCQQTQDFPAAACVLGSTPFHSNVVSLANGCHPASMREEGLTAHSTRVRLPHRLPLMEPLRRPPVIGGPGPSMSTVPAETRLVL